MIFCKVPYTCVEIQNEKPLFISNFSNNKL